MQYSDCVLCFAKHAVPQKKEKCCMLPFTSNAVHVVFLLLFDSLLAFWKDPLMMQQAKLHLVTGDKHATVQGRMEHVSKSTLHAYFRSKIWRLCLLTACLCIMLAVQCILAGIAC